MKRIRATPPPEPPNVPEPDAQPPQPDPGVRAAADALAEVAEVARGAFAEMAQGHREIVEKVTKPRPEAPRPTSFRCTVTERDTRGRIKSIDIEVKG